MTGRDGMDTDTMDAMEFAEWWSDSYLDNGSKALGSVTDAVASRDAYRERQALEKAADRAIKFYTKGVYESPEATIKGIRAAIRGNPTFERGQLVQRKGRPAKVWGAFVWPSSVEVDASDCEPVLDRDGNPVYLPVED